MRLQTNPGTDINQHHGELLAALLRINDKPDAWAEFEAELTEVKRRSLDDRATDSLPYLLGDCLSIEELRALLRDLLDHSADKVFMRKELNVQGSSGDFTEAKSYAHMLQGVLVASDGAIIEALERCVRSESIFIPTDEIRQPVVNEDIRQGTFELIPQLNRDGFRLASVSPDVPLLRLNRLIRHLYPEGSNDGDLEWLLRETQSGPIRQRLSRFLGEAAPEQVVRRLCLTSRAAVERTKDSIGIDNHYTDDTSFVRRILWKLGFMPLPEASSVGAFWGEHNRLRNVVSAAEVSVKVDADAVRTAGVNFYVSLEGLLADALEYATWAFLTDHLAGEAPFHFREKVDSEIARGVLQQAAEQQGIELDFSRPTLYPLVQGFKVLGQELRRRESSAELQPLRALDLLPVDAQGSDLREFPFYHLHVFFDLSRDSRDQLIRGLLDVAQTLERVDLPKVRNDWQHYRPKASPIQEVREALMGVVEAVNLLDDLGLVRVPFSPSGTEADPWGVRRFHYVSDQGKEVSVLAPSPWDLSAFPPYSSTQFLMTSAQLPGGDFLRFKTQRESAWTRMYADYPRRRSSRGSGGLNEEDRAGEREYASGSVE